MGYVGVNVELLPVGLALQMLRQKLALFHEDVHEVLQDFKMERWSQQLPALVPLSSCCKHISFCKKKTPICSKKLP